MTNRDRPVPVGFFCSDLGTVRLREKIHAVGFIGIHRDLQRAWPRPVVHGPPWCQGWHVDVRHDEEAHLVL